MNPDLLSLPLSFLEFMEYTHRILRADAELEDFQSILTSTDGLLSRVASTHSFTDEWVVGEIQRARTVVERGKALVERVTTAQRARGRPLRGWRWGWVLRDRGAVKGIKGLLLRSHITLLHIWKVGGTQRWVEEQEEEGLGFGLSEGVPRSTSTIGPLPQRRRTYPRDPGTTSSTSSMGSTSSGGRHHFGEGLEDPIDDPWLLNRDAWLFRREVGRMKFDMRL